MVKLSYVLIQANHIAEIPYSLSHKKNNQIVVVCPGQKGKAFFEMLNTNANYKNVHPVTFEDYHNQSFPANSLIVLLHPPTTFQILEKLLARSEAQSHSVFLSVIAQNKKYLNFIGKKINNLELSQMAYSPNKFVGINDKIRDLVDQSYDMNRAAFYAYGEFINYLRANLLKKIFRTELLNLDQLARSYGFPSAQRVKEGTFLKPSAQKANKVEKRKRRKLAKKSKAVAQQQVEEDVEAQRAKEVPKKTKKIVKGKGKKPRKAE